MNAPPAQWADLAAWLESMTRALRASDEPALRSGLAQFDAARHERSQRELQRIGVQLHSALESFRLAAGLVDARVHLERVLQLSDEAAHRTTDLVELSYPLAEQTGASAAAMLAQWRAERDAQSISAHAVESFLDQTVHNMSTVGSSLSEVLLAYAHQEQGGRVLRGVSKLIDTIDQTLQALQQLGGGTGLREAPVPAASAHNRHLFTRMGP